MPQPTGSTKPAKQPDHLPRSQTKDTRPMRKILLIVLCFFFPFLAVLLAEGPSIRVLWAFLLQLLGHVPGVIYGIYRISKD